MIWSISLDEVSHFNNEMAKLADSSINNEILYREENIRFIKQFLKFLNYHSSIDKNNFICYRVRKSNNKSPFTKKQELLYPPQNKITQGRMNSNNTSILYTSLHEFTAISESRLDEGEYFQLTRFKTTKEINIFEIGRFSYLYFNCPRDTVSTTELIKQNIGENYTDSFIKEISALENAIINLLYRKDDNYQITAFIADAIFSEFSHIDAIMYPSMQNNFGINFAIKKEFVDNHMHIEYTNFNQLIKKYENGFFQYDTKQEAKNCLNNDLLEFEEVSGCGRSQVR